jgi:hypothetical protein
LEINAGSRVVAFGLKTPSRFFYIVDTHNTSIPGSWPTGSTRIISTISRWQLLHCGGVRCAGNMWSAPLIQGLVRRKSVGQYRPLGMVPRLSNSALAPWGGAVAENARARPTTQPGSLRRRLVTRFDTPTVASSRSALAFRVHADAHDDAAEARPRGRADADESSFCPALRRHQGMRS